MKRPQRERKTVDKILCVDDHLPLLSLYRDELSDEGYEVIVARDGREALMKLDKESPDVVVLDICMPVKGGMETLAAMLRKRRYIPIILNTAYPQYRDDFMTWGADAYVLKSSDLTELKQKIREVLDKRKSPSDPAQGKQ